MTREEIDERNRRAQNVQKAVDNTHPHHRPDSADLYMAGWNAAYNYAHKPKPTATEPSSLPS